MGRVLSNQATVSAASKREFTLGDREFQCIQKLVGEYAGIVITDAKRDMVYSRLVKRLRTLQIPSFRAYCDFLHSNYDEELGHFVNALTTNLTAFFRENHHFEFLKNKVLRELVDKKQRERRIRIWSAGCSTGEEPYSLAIAAREVIPDRDGWDVKILATDLDSNVVETARRGVYSEDRIRDVAQQRLERWFFRGAGANAGLVRVKPELQQLISFRQLNLLSGWPFRGPFDAVFCRNVVIYFDKDTQRRLFDRYADILEPDGYLFIGHSESLFKVSERFELLGNTIYRRIR